MQASQEIIGSWRLVRLDGQYVRVKLTREEMRTIYGGVYPETSEEEYIGDADDHIHLIFRQAVRNTGLFVSC